MLSPSPRPGANTSSNIACSRTLLHPPGARFVASQGIGPLPEGDHFYNRIEGERVDLTDSQFAAPPNYLDVASNRSEALAGTFVSNYEALRATFIARFKSCD